MPLKDELNDLLTNDKLDKAIDLLMEKVRDIDNDTYNTLILLKSRYNSNEKDNNMGVVARSEYLRSKAQITYAFQQTMGKVSKNIMEGSSNGNHNTPANNNLLTQNEIDGYNNLLKLVKEKRLFFEEELIKAYDSDKKFALIQQIKELEEKINDLRQKVSHDLMNSRSINNEVKDGLIETESNIERELKDIKKILQEKSEPQKDKKQVLFICSSPTGKNPLDFGAEFGRIKEAKQIGTERDSYAIEIETSVRANELLKKLSRKPYPDIVHISMHSSKSEGLYFEDKNRNEYPMSVENFKDIFKLFASKHQPSVVILSACNSIKHAEAIKGFAKHIIGTKDFFPDEIAILYANKFYEMIFDGHDIEYAHNAAILSIKHEPLSDEDKNRLKTPLHEIPVLLT